MKLSPQVQKLLQQLLQAINSLGRYKLIIGLLLIVGMVSYIDFRIDHYTGTQSDQAQLEESLSKIKRVRFNSTAIEQIKQLEDPGTTVSPDLPENRTNPFPASE